MSIENAKALIAKAREDKELAEKFRTAGVEGFEKVAEEAGMPCDAEHVEKAMVASGELSDEQLESVAGGRDQHQCVMGCLTIRQFSRS